MRDLCNYSLLHHNTFGISASCQRFLEYASVDEARQVADLLHTHPCQFLIVGGGSNLLLTGDYDGTVVHSALRGMTLTEQPDGSALLCCGSGETWDDVVSWTVQMGFPNLVNLSLIPGDVGASAVQNIGAYGAEAAQYIHEVRAIEVATGQHVTIPAAECRYGYRDSRFKHEWRNAYLITHVVYRLNRHAALQLDYAGIRAELQQRTIAQPTPGELRQVIIDIRRQKLPDPVEMGNAGSFFMNPVMERAKYDALAAQYDQMPHYDVDGGQVKIPAAWLIDQCGWKGRTMGRAGVHDRQALVLVNRGGASGADIVALCRAIQADVRDKFGIELNPEVNIV